MCSAGIQPPEGPPVCAALNFLPLGMPPPISSMISRSVVPIGISTRPTFVILPPSANTFVPFDVSVPMELYHEAPCLIICAMFAYVSTLLSSVGLPNRPFTAGNGGLGLGSPLLPSIEVRSAVSSPQTNAPAPSLISISKLKPLPKMFSPSRPYSLA